MKKPNDMTDEQCMELHAMKCVTKEGFPYFIEAWKPSKEDIEAINRGEPIYLQVLCIQLPPIAMWTMNENNEANI